MPTKRLSFDEYSSATGEDEFAEDTEPSYDSYYVVLPEEVWQSSPVAVEDDSEDGDLDGDLDGDDFEVKEFDADLDADHGVYHGYEPPPREPMSSAKAGAIGGISAALVAGAIPAVVVDLLPAALVGGLAAGVFGGLMGRCLGIELQQRRLRRREAERGF